MIERQGELEGMTPEEMEAAIREMEARHGVEAGMDGGHDGYDYQTSPEFNAYMESQYGMVDMTHEEMYAYEQDFYFGEFDYSWDEATGLYVNSFGDTITYDEYLETIADMIPCFCPCCDSMGGDPQANCPGWTPDCPVQN